MSLCAGLLCGVLALLPVGVARAGHRVGNGPFGGSVAVLALDPAASANLYVGSYGHGGSSGSIFATGPAQPADGLCGLSAGRQFRAAPAADLCASGSASTITGIGSWTWSCVGSNGGSTASCSTDLLRGKPGDCDNSGAVSIDEVQSAISMFLGMKAVAVCVDVDDSKVVTIDEVRKAINSYLGM